MTSINRPQLLVFAGPNGSGKSTVTNKLPIIGAYINADEIKQASGLTDLAAAQEAECARECALAERRSFTFETVLSTPRNLELIERAKAAGFFIEGIFVLTISPEINVSRVQDRVQKGGHDVPPEKIRSRYTKALVNIPRFVALCDKCRIVDNSIVPMTIFVKDGQSKRIFPSPLWNHRMINTLLIPSSLAL